MKANRKAIYNDEEAVSPVIAVILMVAITVVLAATVFVLVNELGQDVGETGPNLGLTTASSSTDPDKWTVRVTSATQSNAISEYTFVFTATGSVGSVEWDGTNNRADFDNITGSTDCFRLTSATGGTNLAVGERLEIQYDADSLCASYTAGSDFPTGKYELEIIHRPTGTSAGSLSREF